MSHQTASTCSFIALTGGSGSGKSWLADQLQTLLGQDACRLSLDDFYRDRSQLPPDRRERLNFDTPAAIDWAEFERVLTSARPGRAVAVPAYDFRTHCRVRRPVPWIAQPLVLVDGLWLFHWPSLRRRFQLRLFLDCPALLRLARRLARDMAGRGRTRESVLDQFHAQVNPMHERHVAPQAGWADSVLHVPGVRGEYGRLAEALWDLLPARSLHRQRGLDAFRAAVMDFRPPAGILPATNLFPTHPHEPIACHPPTA